jgi:hypothetical protein
VGRDENMVQTPERGWQVPTTQIMIKLCQSGQTHSVDGSAMLDLLVPEVSSHSDSMNTHLQKQQKFPCALLGHGTVHIQSWAQLLHQYSSCLIQSH